MSYSMVDEFDAKKYGFKKYLTDNVFLARLNDFIKEFDVDVKKLKMEKNYFMLSFKRIE